MPLGEHLRELRNRLVKAVGAILLATIVAALFYKQLIAFLIDPLPGCVPGRPTGTAEAAHCGLISVNGLLSPFTLALKVSVTAGVVAASPVWLYQLWAFVVPGLYRKERKYSLALLGAGVPLFLCGAAMAYWLLPTTARVLISFTPEKATNLLPIDGYLNLATRMVVVFGLSFELPFLLVLLNLGGVITARQMIGWWRGMFMGIAVFAAVATPSTDPLSMLLLAVPIGLLYLVACAIAWCNDRRRGRTRVGGTGGSPRDVEACPLDLTAAPIEPPSSIAAPRP
ncbi:twin-arginine translocase subunit TatC [Streptomyces glomeratus]|nr:twin-arginine translocase subunit TatC [Streptomyces glomeratus]MCF1510453.1 twin-arginine translocase subunit TatC [Streptomyces glomeratus]